MRRVLLLAAMAPALLTADDHWVRYASGPFHLYTNAGSRAGRDALVTLEEFRWALGQMIGETDLQMPLPIHVFVLKNTKGWALSAPVTEGRASYGIVLDDKTPPNAALYTQLAQMFLDANIGRLPPAFEHGLIEFLSTLEIDGIHITAGEPPVHPDLDWARIHLLVVDPEYHGKLRVLLYNLRKGVDADAAYRNAFGQSAAALNAEATKHLAAGNFQTTMLDSRPLSPRDFQEREVSQNDARLARADLLASQSGAEYEALLKDHVKVPEAEEGLGLLALSDHNTDGARQHFEAATAAGSTSARAYIEYAKLEPDNAKATQALLHAAGINPKLDEPFALLAARDTDPAKRVAHWKEAADRNPRNAAYWKNLAEAYLAEKDFDGAAKAWTQGEQAATDPAERDRMRQARLQIEQQRLDYLDAQKRQEAADLEKLKDQARAHVHELEQKYSQPDAAGTKVVPWWDGPKPSGKISGELTRVDCLGKQARLSIEGDGHKTTKLLVPDAAKIVLLGGADQALGCGAQKARPVTVEYFPKLNSRLGTAGEAATIEFQ